mmetsp:Transcript_30768/g.40650  ORF Transcript_30768/g.40650 Transcript_30768/m.40650 type:complete len:207 (+) Transcript_30768:38-658(+)
MSKKKKGVSFEEKRSRILNIYHTKKEVLNLKELEKLGVKEGVVYQSIKDVNQSLVDDNLVDNDKIGSANFFWSFPSKVFITKKSLVESLEQKIDETEEKIAQHKRKVEELINEGREDTEERRVKLARLRSEEERSVELDGQLESLKENDPKELERIANEADQCKEAVNRWTDNIWAIKSWCVKKKGMASKEVDRYMQLPSDFDYIS